MNAKIAKRGYSVETQAVTVSFVSGKVVEVRLDALTPDMVIHLALHGLGQKLGDSYSGCGGDLNVALAAVEGVKASLENGEWNQRGEGMGAEDLISAVSELKDINELEAREAIAALDKKQLAGLKKHPKVVSIIAQRKADRASEKAEKATASDFDLDSLV